MSSRGSQVAPPSCRRPATAPTRRPPTRRTTPVSSTQVVRERLGRLVQLGREAGPLEGLQLPDVGRDRPRQRAPSRSPTVTARAGWARSGRRSAVRRTACSWRQAAIAPWSPESSTGGHLAAAPGGGAGVDGVLEQAVLVRLLEQRVGVAHEAGQQPGHRLDDHQGGGLAAVEHVVADRHLAHLGPASRRPRPPAGRCPRSGRRRARGGRGRRARGRAPGEAARPTARARRAWRRRAARRRAPRPTARASSPCRRRRRRGCRRRCGGGRGSTSRRSCTCTSSSPASRALPASDSPSGARYSGKMVTTSTRTAAPSVLERGDQARAVGDDDAAAVEVDLGHQRRDERHQRVAAVGGADDEQVLRAAADQPRDRARARARPRRTPRGRRAGGRRTPRGRRAARRRAPRPAGGSRAAPRRPRGPSTCSKVSSRTPWCQRTPRTVRAGTGAATPCGRRTSSTAPTREPALRLVGADLDGHLAAHAVRLADPADDDLDGASAPSVELSRPRSGSS